MRARLATLIIGGAVAVACAASPVPPAQEARPETKRAAPGALQGRGAPPPVVPIPAGFVEHRGGVPAHPSAAYAWVEILLEVSARDVERAGARPTIISRQMAISMTAMYDAWAAYDEKAVGTRLGNQLRRPAPERTPQNKAKAMAHATYRALVDLFPTDKTWLDETMRKMGYDPVDRSTDVTTPQGIGNAAANAVLAYRRHDGSNQFGDDPGSNGKPYGDTTGYKPRNPVDKIVDPDCWQPIPFSDGKGGFFYPDYLTPHWGKVKPFALDKSDRFRSPPPPKVGSPELKKQTDECIALNGNLSLEQKAIVEFMRDGPRSTGQSGHWMQVAEDVSRRESFGLDADVKLFFAVANTAFDAFIAAWDTKTVFDSSRPWTLIRHYYRGQTIKGYLGPGLGFGPIPAEKWHPYSPATFPTPPFPGYVSGHSTVSGACAKTLELFTHGDRYGAYTRMHPGQWTEPGVSAKRMQAMEGRAEEGVPDAPEVVLMMPTFSGAADMAGISRIMGGYHIEADNVEGLKLGRSVATFSWPKYEAYFNGGEQR